MKLLILHVHGIGPQMQTRLSDFLHAIRAASRRKIALPDFRGTGADQPFVATPDAQTAPAAAEAVMPCLHWDDLFGAPKQVWGQRLYPQEARLHQRLTQQRLVLWGDFIHLVRLFEMQEGSDAFIYAASEEHRQLVFERVFDVLEHPACLGPLTGWPDEVPVVFSGHSLGSVIVYDLLRYSSGNAAGSADSVARELRLLRAADASPRELPQEERERLQRRLKFLERAEQVLRRLRPLGMFTYGSPISLFLFRKLGLWQGRERFAVWDDVCPQEFQQGLESSRTPGLAWQWRNYWHWFDFVAHRLAPVMNDGYPPSASTVGALLRTARGRSARAPLQGEFVSDVQCRYLAGSPMTGHTGYMRQQRIAADVAAHIVRCLDQLPELEFGGAA